MLIKTWPSITFYTKKALVEKYKYSCDKYGFDILDPKYLTFTSDEIADEEALFLGIFIAELKNISSRSPLDAAKDETRIDLTRAIAAAMVNVYVKDTETHTYYDAFGRQFHLLFNDTVEKISYKQMRKFIIRHIELVANYVRGTGDSKYLCCQDDFMLKKIREQIKISLPTVSEDKEYHDKEEKQALQVSSVCLFIDKSFIHSGNADIDPSNFFNQNSWKVGNIGTEPKHPLAFVHENHRNSIENIDDFVGFLHQYDRDYTKDNFSILDYYKYFCRAYKQVAYDIKKQFLSQFKKELHVRGISFREHQHGRTLRIQGLRTTWAEIFDIFDRLKEK